MPFWDYAASFGVGAGAGAVIAATGGTAGAGFWAVAGVSAAGGAVTGGTNNILAQTGKNFSGFGQVDWDQVGKTSAIGGVAGFAGSAAGTWASSASFLVNGVSSPVLRSAIVSPLAAGAGHIAGGTTANLFEGQNLGDAFTGSFEGIGQNMAIGGALGIASTVGVSYANKINPWNGNPSNTSNHAVQRTNERKVSQSDINDALQNPLKITDVKIQENGPSVKYIGTRVTVVVNPKTGNIITTYPTSTQRVNSILNSKKK